MSCDRRRMYKPTDKQRGLFGASSGLNERLRGRLEKSWAEGFQKEVLPVLLAKEGEFAHLYGQTGRPNWSVARMVGLLVLRELLLLKSDRELAESFAFDLRFQHALDVSAPEDRVISERSIAGFRARLAQGDPEGRLLQSVFSSISETVVRRLALSTKEQRTDSTFVTSNIQRRNRESLLQEVLRTFLQEVKRASRLDEVEEPLRKWFEQLGGWDSPPELRQLGQWMSMLVTRFAEDEELGGAEAYQTLATVLDQHFVVEDDESDSDDEAPPPSSSSRIRRRKNASSSSKARRKKKKARRKQKARNKRGGSRRSAKRVAPREFVRGAIQSPHDLDARKGRKGVGFQFHVTETCGNDGRPEVLTDVTVVSAEKHDSTQLPGILERLAEKGLTPDTLLADGAYPTPDNLEEAEKHGTALCAPVHRGNLAADDPKMSREDFSFDDEGRVTACPEGHAPRRHAPLRSSAVPHRALHVLFDGSRCAACSRRHLCPTQSHNRGKERKLCIAPRLRKRDAHLKAQQQAPWRQRYRLRAGVEATMSELARAHGAKRSSVRGLTALRAQLLLKATACNVKRLVRALVDRRAPRCAPPRALTTLRVAFQRLRDRIRRASAADLVATFSHAA